MKGDKSERIIRILLENPDGNLTAYRIHVKAECSEQWTGSYLKKLENMNLINNTKVTNIHGLFEHWLRIRSPLEFAEYHLQKDPLVIIKNSNLSYALTTYQADNLIHKYLFPTRTDIYILKDDVEGGNARRLLVGETKSFYESPVIVTSPISNGSIGSGAAQYGYTRHCQYC